MINTGHRTLKWILSIADTTEKLARGELKPMKFHLEIIHKAGIKHHAADWLPRLSTDGADNKNIDDKIAVLAIQEQSCTEKHHLPCSHHKCDDTIVNLDLHPIRKAKPTI